MEPQTTTIDLRGSGRASSGEDFGVLADPSGRRRRSLRRAGRAVTVLFGLWLAALALAGLGLLPDVGIPLASRTTADGAPPPLDERSPLVAAKDSRPALTHAATATATAKATPTPVAPRCTGPTRPRPTVRERRAAAVRPVPSGTAPAATSPAGTPAAATPAPLRPATAPGHAAPSPGHSGTAPGQTRPAKTPVPTATPTPVHGKSDTAPGRSGR